MLRIREERQARGWTQERLAEAIGASKVSLQRWESGERDPRSAVLLAISDALGIPIQRLYGRDDAGSSFASILSEEESRLLALYGSLSPKGRARLMEDASIYAMSPALSRLRDE